MKKYELQMSYHLVDGWYDIQKEIHKAIGRSSDFSGAGFGVRDLGWSDLTKKDCDRLAPICKELGSKIEGFEYAFLEVCKECKLGNCICEP